MKNRWNDPDAVQNVVAAAVRRFGGLDVLVSNAGFFPANETIDNLSAETWKNSLAVNLTGHQRMLKAAILYTAAGGLVLYRRPSGIRLSYNAVIQCEGDSCG